MKIKQNCVVAAIDKLILWLSIPQIWNLERNISGFEPENILIKYLAVQSIPKKREMDYRLYISVQSFSLGRLGGSGRGFSIS